jgi:hypothetical protein
MPKPGRPDRAHILQHTRERLIVLLLGNVRGRNKRYGELIYPTKEGMSEVIRYSLASG